MHNQQKTSSAHQRGFTILEVLIALLIASISITGLLIFSQGTIQNLDVKKNQVLANIVAHNVAIETRLSNRPAIGIQDDEYTLSNATWYYQKVTEQVKKLDVTKTTINVYQTKEEKSNKKPITSLELYLPTVNIESSS